MVVGPHIDEEGFGTGLLCSDVEGEALGQPNPSLLLGSQENVTPGYYHVHFHLCCHWHGIRGEVQMAGPSGPWEGCVWMKVQKKTLWRTNYECHY